MPLTHIGRVCPIETEIKGIKIPPGGRVSLGWAAANFDPEVFDEPEKIDLTRKPNPHVSFGFGTHLCLGAPHARLIIRSLLEALVAKGGNNRNFGGDFSRRRKLGLFQRKRLRQTQSPISRPIRARI